LKNYYRSFAAVAALDAADRTEFLPYIWRQKAEISAMHDIGREFWVTLDYSIGLTMQLLKNTKETMSEPIQTVLRPIFGRINRELNTILQKVTDEEFGYLKHELKILHHIVSHTINLVDKNVAHFVPRFLFISLIEQMRLLQPLGERTVDPALLARGDYRLLVTRHVARQFSTRLVGIIDFLLWYREVSPVLLPEHQQEYQARLTAMVREALDERLEFAETEGYSMREMIVELREIVTTSLIAEKFMEILNELSYSSGDAPIKPDKWLAAFCSVFMPIETDERGKNNTIVRDLTIAEILLTDAMMAAEAGDTEKLYRQIFLAGSMRPFLINVTGPLLPPKIGLELDIFLEIMEFLDHLYPEVIITADLSRAFRKTRQLLDEEIERVKVTGAVTITDDDIHLFIDKANSLRGREPIAPTGSPDRV
jgi:hypothetical protein